MLFDRFESLSTQGLRRSRSGRLWNLAIAASLAATWDANALAGDFGSMVIFGDSLSDVGNAYNSDFHLDPTSPYYNGRFSNGPLWVEDLAADLSLSAPAPSTSSGKDYAYGGVHTGSGTTRLVIFNFPNIGTQIGNYLSSNTPASNGLFVVWGGGNDFIDGQTDPSVPVNNIVQHVTALANAGAKTVIVPNLPALGEIPRFRGTANESTMNNLSGQFNSMLKTSLTTLSTTFNIHIDQLDVANFFSSAIANPSAYGFTNVTTPADNNGTVVSNPDQYLFWDDIHPTRVGHQLLANVAFDLVSTHNWIAIGSATFGTAGNWDPANTVDATWIANLRNASTSPKTAIVSGAATVRQIQVSGNSAGNDDGCDSAGRYTHRIAKRQHWFRRRDRYAIRDSEQPERHRADRRDAEWQWDDRRQRHQQRNARSHRRGRAQPRRDIRAKLRRGHSHRSGWLGKLRLDQCRAAGDARWKHFDHEFRGIHPASR